MKTNIDSLMMAYDAGVEDELIRLSVKPEGRAEFEVICSMLDKFISPNAVVYDIGAGPGRYAEYLLNKACRVAAIDISEKSLKAFKQRINGHFKENMLFSRQCCATQLQWLESHSADAILLMGPLYHLVDEDERKSTLAHCWRLLKPDGILFSVFMNILTEKDNILSNQQFTEVDFQGYRIQQYRCKPAFAEKMLNNHGFTTEKLICLDNGLDTEVVDYHSFLSELLINGEESTLLNECCQFLHIGRKNN